MDLFDINSDMYVGTKDVHCILIDPDSKQFSEVTLHRDTFADEIQQYVGDTAKVYPLCEKRSRTIFDLHSLAFNGVPHDDDACFWIQTDIHEKGVQFKGRALLLARSPDQKRVASARIDLERINHFFRFEEPVAQPHSLEFMRLLQPIREQAEKLVDLQKNIDPLETGYIELGMEKANVLLAVLEIIAHDIDTHRSPPYEQLDATDFLTHTYERLLEEGYLNPDMCSDTLRYWVDAYL